MLPRDTQGRCMCGRPPERPPAGGPGTGQCLGSPGFPVASSWAHGVTPAVFSSSESERVVDMAFLGTRAGLLRSSLFVGSEKVSDK